MSTYHEVVAGNIEMEETGSLRSSQGQRLSGRLCISQRPGPGKSESRATQIHVLH